MPLQVPLQVLALTQARMRQHPQPRLPLPPSSVMTKQPGCCKRINAMAVTSPGARWWARLSMPSARAMPGRPTQRSNCGTISVTAARDSGGRWPCRPSPGSRMTIWRESRAGFCNLRNAERVRAEACPRLGYISALAFAAPASPLTTKVAFGCSPSPARAHPQDAIRAP